MEEEEKDDSNSGDYSSVGRPLNFFQVQLVSWND